jgi:predicted RNA-binding Zn ribbon-like protein
MSRRFQFLAGHPVLDFANTLDYRYEPAKRLELLESNDDLVQFGLQSGLLAPAEAHKRQPSLNKSARDRYLHYARELREAVEGIFAASTDGGRVKEEDLDILNSWIREASSHRRIQNQKKAFVWAWYRTLNDPASLLLWRISHAAAELLTSPELQLVRRCDAANCRWLFLDKSKNHSRRWCDMKICGNREKARAYYRRVASES